MKRSATLAWHPSVQRGSVGAARSMTTYCRCMSPKPLTLTLPVIARRVAWSYAGVACIGTVAWGGVLFLSEWDRTAAQDRTARDRLRGAAAHAAWHIPIAVCLGVVWPLAPLFVDDVVQRFEHRDAARRRDQERRENSIRRVAESRAEAAEHRRRRERKWQKQEARRRAQTTSASQSPDTLSTAHSSARASPEMASPIGSAPSLPSAGRDALKGTQESVLAKWFLRFC